MEMGNLFSSSSRFYHSNIDNRLKTKKEMKPVGYVLIKANPKTGISPAPISDFVGKPIRVMEFASDGGVLCINSEATALATFDKEDIYTSFKCNECYGIILPPDIEVLSSKGVQFLLQRQQRKGGYDHTVRACVIASSLAKGEFNDDFLFQKQ